MKDEENLAMIVKFVKYLIDKDVLDKQYEEDSIYGLTIMLEKIAAYVVLFCIAFIVRKPIEGIIFTVSFMAVRQTTGGFHAKSFLGYQIKSGGTAKKENSRWKSGQPILPINTAEM